jgi:hypothetical protein
MYLIVIFGLFVLREHFERLPPDDGLYVTASTVTLFDLLILSAFSFLLRFVRFADHFGFTVGPNSVHAFFGIPDMSDLLGKVWVGLTRQDL